MSDNIPCIILSKCLYDSICSFGYGKVWKNEEGQGKVGERNLASGGEGWGVGGDVPVQKKNYS